MTGAWEMIFAVLVAVLLRARLRLRGIRTFLLAMAIWIAIDVARGQFPAGSFGLETLGTALLVRALRFESLAGVAARVLLLLLAFGALAGFARIGRWAKRWRRVAVAALLLVVAGCSEPDPANTYFAPGTGADPSALVQFSFDDPSRPAPHPVIPVAQRSNDTCLACHAQRVAATERPLARKGVHEVHARVVGVAQECRACHGSAGRAGFPGERPGELTRREASEACARCHTEGGAPFWRRVVR